MDPGSMSLRHDVQLLADAGVIRSPVTTWPLSWPDVARDVLADAAADGLSAAEAQALARVRHAAAAASRPGLGWSGPGVEVASDPETVRGFSATPREDAALTGGVQWLGASFEARGRVALVSDPDDGQELRLDGSYVGATFGNVALSAGAVDRWWGPGWDGSLILGTNARPFPALTIERRIAEASKLPVLRAFGPWRASVTFGQAEGSGVPVPDVRLFFARVSSRPWPWLEVGLSRSAQWCGEGRPCGWSTFWDLLVGRDNRDESLSEADEPGNQLAGYDLRLRSPWARLPVAFYGQFIGEDEAGTLPSKFLGLLGFEAWGGSEAFGSWRARFEYADTTCDFSRSSPQFDCAYRNNLYPQGYTYRQRILGHSLDNDSRSYTLGASWTRPSGTAFSGRVRRLELNRDGVADSIHATSPLGASELLNVELEMTMDWRGVTVAAGVGYDDYSRPATTGSEGRGFIRVSRGL
jgi:hypothetical protein